MKASLASQGGSYEPVRLLVPNMFMNWLRNPGSLGFPHHTRTSNRSSRFTRVSEPKVRRVARNHYPGAIPLCRLQWIPLCFWPRPVRPLAPPPPATAARRCPVHPLPIIDRTGWLLVRSAVRGLGGVSAWSPLRRLQNPDTPKPESPLSLAACAVASRPPPPSFRHPPCLVPPTRPLLAVYAQAGRTSHDTQSPARGVRRGRGRCLAEKERAASLLG